MFGGVNALKSTGDNESIAVDETGIYVVTSKRMPKVVWTGTKLSMDEADGGWQSEYNTMSDEEALTAGAISRGSGTTPTLMGFGDDPDRLVVSSDADAKGAHLVAFWRDQIRTGFKQKPGTTSAIHVALVPEDRRPTIRIATVRAFRRVSEARRGCHGRGPWRSPQVCENNHKNSRRGRGSVPVRGQACPTILLPGAGRRADFATEWQTNISRHDGCHLTPFRHRYRLRRIRPTGVIRSSGSCRPDTRRGMGVCYHREPRGAAAGVGRPGCRAGDPARHPAGGPRRREGASRFHARNHPAIPAPRPPCFAAYARAAPRTAAPQPERFCGPTGSPSDRSEPPAGRGRARGAPGTRPRPTPPAAPTRR